jgi:hypothetical protein
MIKSNCPKFKFIVFPSLLFIGCLLFMYALHAADFLGNKKTIAAIGVNYTDSAAGAAHSEFSNPYSVLYDQMNLDSLGLSHEAFMYGLQGYTDLTTAGQLKNDRILTIADFSLPSSKKRLFVIDLLTGKLLFNTFVSHGRNSGTDMATEFSNDLNSFKSSLGFYVTGNTYKGEHGYSLRLEGLEEGINDNASDRDIVMHAANYVNEKIVKVKGYIGRSLGCPAVPPAMNKAIINTIKNGSCLFLYSPNEHYLTTSKLIGMPGAPQQPDSTLPKV